MPVPSETAPGCDGLPLIDHAAARELFRTAECTGLGRPGTDEIFDQWLDGFSDIAFYRNGDLPGRRPRPADHRSPLGRTPHLLP
ncbi:hypothetical protein ACFYVM_12105 [Streptomyces sp. NPDC003280]|uniref:hypothetical protein n=1 Tax=Streptomyces sp. NPDC003280 TaxID=3364680 RepID=UPI0036883AF9